MLGRHRSNLPELLYSLKQSLTHWPRMKGSSNVEASRSSLRSPLTPFISTLSGRMSIDRRRIIIAITLTAVAVSVIRLVAYIYYSAKLQDDRLPVDTIPPDKSLEDMIYPAYWAAIYYLCAVVSLFLGYKSCARLLHRRLKQQRQQTYLRTNPYSTFNTLCYRYLGPSFTIPLITSSTTLGSVLVVIFIAVLNLICVIYPNSPSQVHLSNRAAYLSVANFALLIPISIRSFPWLAYDTAISWHRVFAILAFASAAQHGCYHLSERLESLEPILDSGKHVTGLISLSIIAFMLLTAHEVVRSNQYACFRTLHLLSFLSLIISASLHNRSFLLLNFIGILAWTISRFVRKIKARSNIVSIHTTGRIAKVTLEHSLKGITAGQFAYLGVTGPGFSKQGWARPFSFSSIHGIATPLSSPLEEGHEKDDQDGDEANSSVSQVQSLAVAEAHHRPGFHHEPSSTQVPDKKKLEEDSVKKHEQNSSSPSNVVDMHIHSRGAFTSSLLKAASASQRDLESKSSYQLQVELDGPYGMPWLSVAKHYYTDFEMVLFVCSGVGITPWLAVMQQLLVRPTNSRTRVVYVIWSIHDIGK